jgi:hypothetical protein
MRYIKSNWHHITILALLATILFFVFATPRGICRTTEIRPEVQIESYKSDMARMVEAYERLMDRYIGMVERNMQAESDRIVAIDQKLDEISWSLMRIEEALGINSGEATKSSLYGSDDVDTADSDNSNYKNGSARQYRDAAGSGGGSAGSSRQGINNNLPDRSELDDFVTRP